MKGLGKPAHQCENGIYDKWHEYEAHQFNQTHQMSRLLGACLCLQKLRIEYDINRVFPVPQKKGDFPHDFFNCPLDIL